MTVSEVRKAARREAERTAGEARIRLDPSAVMARTKLGQAKDVSEAAAQVARVSAASLLRCLFGAREPSPLTRGHERVVPQKIFNPLNEFGVAEGEEREIAKAPGWKWNLKGGKGSKLGDVRNQTARALPGTGVTAVPGGPLKVKDIPNPDRPDGKWDPYQFMPHFIFGKGEDNFPVRPSFDGDSDLSNNASKNDANTGPYVDGVMGGNQALNGAFTVTRKDDYIVQTYSFYSAKDKGGFEYHKNDYHTVQVYLQPGRNGKLEPKHMLTSFHHGAVLNNWKDLRKDAQGRPIVEVKRGTHALRPLGHSDSLPKGRIEILGNGQALRDGKPLKHQLSFDAFQSNIEGAKRLDPKAPEGEARRQMMEWGDVPLRPLHPNEFPDFAQDNPVKAQLPKTLRG